MARRDFDRKKKEGDFTEKKFTKSLESCKVESIVYDCFRYSLIWTSRDKICVLDSSGY